MEASEPKGVNSMLDFIWVNSLRLGGLQIIYVFSFFLRKVAHNVVDFTQKKSSCFYFLNSNLINQLFHVEKAKLHTYI